MVCLSMLEEVHRKYHNENKRRVDIFTRNSDVYRHDTYPKRTAAL